MIDFKERPIPEDDGQTHINTHSIASTRLGQILSLSYDSGAAINHPLMGPFRTVENLWSYLNTGGTIDKVRAMEPAAARNIVRLSPKYSCDRFRELTVDYTLLKMEGDPSFMDLMVENELPFDHYYTKGKDQYRVTIRPTHAHLIIGVFNDVRDILRGTKEHVPVRLKDMNFTKLDK